MHAMSSTSAASPSIDPRMSGISDDRKRIGTGRASGSGMTRTVTFFSCGYVRCSRRATTSTAACASRR